MRLSIAAAALLVCGATFGCDQNKGGDQAKAKSPGSSSKKPAPSAGSTGEKAPSKGQKPGSAAKAGGTATGDAGMEKVTEEELEKFARVQIRMKKYSETEEMKKKPKGKKAKIERMMKMKKKADSVMKDLGIDKRRYAKIGRRMREDPKLQKRLRSKIDELQSEKSGASAGGDAG